MSLKDTINKTKTKLSKAENTETENVPVDRDEELFTTLEQEKIKKKRRRRRIIIIVIAAVLIALILGIFFLRRSVNRKFNSTVGDVVSYDAKVGSISTTVSGTGSLTNVDQETIQVPYGISIDEVVVETGENVKKGDVIATVDIASVKSKMADIQTSIDTLDEELGKVADETLDTTIYSGVAGRIKKVYALEGMTVTDCMYKNGALALVSLDGYMAVDIKTRDLSSGDVVTVVLSDGKEEKGSVELAAGGSATILITDDGPVYRDTVTVKGSDGSELGTGKLYVHNPLKITAVTGNIYHVYAEENQKIYSGSTICSVSDTDYSGSYSTVLKKRSEYLDVLMDLVTIYNDGALLAPFDGSITEVIYDDTATGTTTTSTSTSTTTTTMVGNMTQSSISTTTSADTVKYVDIVTLSPDLKMDATISVDESNILSLEVGQTAQVYVTSISSDQAFDGVVTKISKTATSSSGVTRYSAVITIDKTPEMLAGMRASVVIRIQGVENAVIIPVEALHQTSSTSFVFTGYDENEGRFTGRTEVEVGIQNSSYVEVTSGLKEGDTVYYTETEDSMFATMGGMPGGFGGERPDFGGGMPDFGSGGMPDFSGGPPSGGNFGGSGGGFSGGPPSGGNFGGGMPGR